MEIKQLAEIAHEVNRIWCRMNGDLSQPIWAEAPVWQKNSAIEGIKFKQENPDSTPSNSHVSWYEHKEADGWKFGEEKDAFKKTHPCMVDYEDLPEFQKVKDSLFQAIASLVDPIEEVEEEEL